MKKIIFSTMIVSLLALVGCQNEELVNETTDNGNGKKVTLTATIAGAANSRVVLSDKDENNNPLLDENDNPIVMVNWEESGEGFTVYNADYSGKADFTQDSGNEFTSEDPLPAGDKTAYYGNYIFSNGALSYDLSSQDGTLNEDNILMQASVTDGSSKITFEHKTAILKVKFKGVNNQAVTEIVMDNVHTGSNNESITVTPTKASLGYFYIFLPIEDENSYGVGHTFNFTVTVGSNEYTGLLTIPTGMSIEAGNLYTANIKLTEVPTYCYLPEPDIDNDSYPFTDAILEALYNNSQLTKIEFKANSNVTSNTQIGTCGAYLVANEAAQTLEIHTSASVFVFPENCKGMFIGNYFYGETGVQPLSRITSINFNNFVNTSNVTDMNNMFRSLSALKELDLSCFDTSNVTNMSLMFAYCSNLEMLNLSSFNVNKVTNFKNMLWMMSELENGMKTQVYVPDPNPFADKNTGINNNFRQEPADSEYAEYVIGTPQ